MIALWVAGAGGELGDRYNGLLEVLESRRMAYRNAPHGTATLSKSLAWWFASAVSEPRATPRSQCVSIRGVK